MRNTTKFLIITSVIVFLFHQNVIASNRKNVDSLFMVAIEYSHHGDFEKSNESFNRILSEFKISSKKRDEIYTWLSTNGKLSGDYKAQYKYQLLKSGKNDNVQSKILAELPEQSVIRPHSNDTVSYDLDTIYYDGKVKGYEILLPVEICGKKENFILDNGCAQFSFSSESFAKEHNIHPIGINGSAIGVVDKVSMYLGLADSLSVGNMIFKNIIFIVVPDEMIENSFISINAILGSNFFRLVGEMIFDNTSRSVVFPYIQQDKESNLTIGPDGVHYMNAEINHESLIMQLDLGAAYSELNANYYKKHKKYIESKYSVGTSNLGGVGGLRQETTYSIPELAINSCGGCYIKKDTKISTTKRPHESFEDGAIGNDFLLSFSKVIINLNKMYLYTVE